MVGTVKRVLFAGLSLVCIVAISGCGASTTSSAMDIVVGKAFNVTGNWTGTLTDSEYGPHAVILRINDSEGTLTGVLSVTDHVCLGVDATEMLVGTWNLTVEGTATGAAENTEGDNPLTPVQENSNNGSVSLTTTTFTETVINEAGEEVDYERQVAFALGGNSKSLTGTFSGNWIGTGLTCRSGIEGTLTITRP